MSRDDLDQVVRDPATELPMTVARALADNHLESLAAQLLPSISEALRLGPIHPDADPLMAEAYRVCLESFHPLDGWHEDVAWHVFRTLVGVAEFVGFHD